MKAVSAARHQADIVVVSSHWGYEYGDVVRVQRELGGGTMVPVAVELYPLWNDGGRTITSPPQRATRLLADLQRRSLELGVSFELETDRLVVELGP